MTCHQYSGTRIANRGHFDWQKSLSAAGGAGVAIGRNIFQAEDPAAMTAAVAAILHQAASVDEALAILKNTSRI